MDQTGTAPASSSRYGRRRCWSRRCKPCMMANGLPGPRGRDQRTRAVDGSSAPRSGTRRRAGHAYVILDGTLIPIGRLAGDRPFYSGKHQKHGMNLQVIASPDGDIVWGVRGAPRVGARQERRNGSGACWPSWKPPAWSSWPLRLPGQHVREDPGPGQEQARIPEAGQ
jgi:hypothetical protein